MPLFQGEDSNPDSRNQNPASYPLDEPGIVAAVQTLGARLSIFAQQAFASASVSSTLPTPAWAAHLAAELDRKLAILAHAKPPIVRGPLKSSPANRHHSRLLVVVRLGFEPKS